MIRRYLKMGERLPRGYGYAWYDFARGQTVIYPIPLNWVMWALRAIHYRLVSPPEAAIDKLYCDAVQRGNRDGFKIGYEDGIAEARAEAEKTMAFLKSLARRGDIALHQNLKLPE